MVLVSRLVHYHAVRKRPRSSLAWLWPPHLGGLQEVERGANGQNMHPDSPMRWSCYLTRIITRYICVFVNVLGFTDSEYTSDIDDAIPGTWILKFVLCDNNVPSRPSAQNDDVLTWKIEKILSFSLQNYLRLSFFIVCNGIRYIDECCFRVESAICLALALLIESWILSTGLFWL